jgi:hypothetical protein
MTSTKKGMSGPDAFMHLITLLGVVFLAVVLVMALAAMVIMVAWSGFVTPVFGYAPLSFSEAFFAIVFLGIFKIMVMKTSKNEIRFKV